MSTFSILAAFALMLFLPCAIAVLGSRNVEEDSAYTGGATKPVAITRIARPLVSPVAAAPSQSKIAATKPVLKAEEPKRQEVSDPAGRNHTQTPHQSRILRSEVEARVAAAASARAQADALAASARLAVAKAEAANAQALAAEEAAEAAIQEMHRAA